MRVGLLVCIMAAFADASESQKRIEWLREHAIAMESIEPEDTDYSDLESLSALIGNARVVQLGEQSHGDGAAFLAKARLIRYLHEKMGFDVLVFESGLYDCRKAWQSLKSGVEAHAAFREGVFGIWTGSAQVRPLIDYVAGTVDSKSPLELAGCDCQFTGTASRDSLLDDLNALIKSVDPPIYSEDEFDLQGLFESTVRWLVGGSDPAKSANAMSRLESLEDFAMRLEGPAIAATLPENEVAFWRQLAKSMIGQARQSLDLVHGGRDQQMGENLIWLANECYPDRKLIVWAATMHEVRNAPKIGVPGRPGLYDDTVTMGHVAWKTLGSDIFTIGFTAAEGKVGRFWDPPRELDPSEPGSLEDLLVRAGFEYAIVPFTNAPAGGEWLEEALIARPLGYMPSKAVWSRHMDAMCFTRVMTPSTRKREAMRPRWRPPWRAAIAPAKSALSFQSRLDARWREIAGDLGNDDSRIERIDFVATYGAWKQAEAPEAAAICMAYEGIKPWLSSALLGLDEQVRPGMIWRSEHLLSLMSRDCGLGSEQRKHLERALANAPQSSGARADAQDRIFQLVNDLAFLVWDQDGFAAALDLVTRLVAEDHRVRILDVAPWLARLTDAASAGDRATFIARMRQAYAERATRFPDMAAESRRAANRLH